MSRRVAAGVILSIAAGLIIIGGAYLWFPAFRWGPVKHYAGPVEKITIGTDRTGTNALLWIARTRGYDQEQGLELAIKNYQAGRDAVRDLKAGRLDLACCAEFALVSEILAGAADLRCLVAISSGEIDELIARRDKGINRPEDLRGKSIGVPRTTSAEFFLGKFLTFNQIALKDVTIVNVNPFDLAEALAAGKVDAVLIWEPITYEIIKKMGPNAIAWPAQEGQDFYWLLVGQEEYIKRNPGTIERLLQALAQAADFIKRQPEAAREIMAQWMQVPLADLQIAKYPKRYELFLDQALLLAMEDEARWMMRHKLTEQTRLPDFLDYFYAAPLAKILPQGVHIIIPRGENRNGPDLPGTGQGR
jgi:NitT/TauT family transport system substrate-binding protein